MSKLRIAYIASLVILAVLIGLTMLRPLTTKSKYSEVSRQQLLQTETEYIIQFDIMNHEGKERKYTINVLLDGKSYSEDILIPNGRIFTYVQHVYRDRVTEDNVRFAIYKEGAATPFEEITYYLKW